MRGLYRIERLVRKYHGLITVRTHQNLVCRDHSFRTGFKNIRNKAPYPYFPGTITRVRLSPTAHLNEPRFLDRTELDALPELAKGFGQDRLLHIGSIPPSGLDERQKASILEEVTCSPNSRPRCLYVISEGKGYNKNAVEKALLDLTKISAPTAIIVFGLPGTDDELDVSTQSVNSVIEDRCLHSVERGFDEFESCSAVMVISNTAQVTWVGVPRWTRAILSMLDQHGVAVSEKAIAELLSASRPPITADELQDTIRSLRNLVNLVEATEDDNWQTAYKLCAGPARLAQLIEGRVDDVLNDTGPTTTVIRRRGPFLTPTLQTVDVWIDAPRLLERLESAGYLDAVVFAMVMKLGRVPLMPCPAKALLADPSSCTGIPQRMREILGIETVVEPFEPLIDPDLRDPVTIRRTTAIIYADILSSTESVKRAIHFAQKRGYQIVAVCCLVDARSVAGESINAWSERIPVVFLSHLSTVSAAKGTTTVIGPSFSEENDDDPYTGMHRLPDDLLINILSESSAAWLGHRKRSNGRHLTFGLKPEGLLESQAIRSKLRETIIDWCTNVSKDHNPLSLSDNSWHVIIPVDDGSTKGWEGFVKDVFNCTPDAKGPVISLVLKQTVEGQSVLSLRTLPHALGGKDVLILDWGTVTGHTLMQLSNAAAVKGARSILTCALVSQMSTAEERFVGSVSQLGLIVPNPLPAEDLFAGHNNFVPHSVPFKFHWISSIPLGHHAARDCPVCSQLDDLDRRKPPTEFLAQHAEAERVRLAGSIRRSMAAPAENEYCNPVIVAQGQLGLTSSWRTAGCLGAAPG